MNVNELKKIKANEYTCWWWQTYSKGLAIGT